MAMSAEIQELLVRLSLQDGLTSGVNKALGSVGKLEGGMGRATKGAGQLGKGIIKAGAVAAVAAGTGLAFAAHKAIEMDDAFAAVVKTVGDASANELQALNDQLHALATRIPVSYTDLAGIAAEAGALGVARKDIAGFTETVARLSAATQGLTTEAAAEAFGKFRNSLHLTEADLERSASALIALGNAGASSEGDIIEIGKRFAGAGKTAGLSAAQVLGLSSAISSVGVAPEAAGGSLSRLFNNINKFIGTGDKKLAAFAKTTGLTEKAFAKAFGKDALGTFEKFLAGLSKLSAPEQQARLKAAGVVNVRDISALQLLAGSYQEVQRQTDLATDAFQKNTDLADVSAKRFDTLKNKIAVLKNNFYEATYNIAEGFLPALGRATDKLTAFLQLPSTKKSLQDLGRKLGESLDKVDFNKLLTAAKSAVDVLQPMLDALLGISGVLNSLPSEVKGVALGAIVANKASGGLIGAGLGNILGGLGETFARSLASKIPLFGSAFVQPVFVTNQGFGAIGDLLGKGGLGVLGSAGGGLLAGAAIPVILTAGSIAALGAAFYFAMQQHPDARRPGLKPSEGGDVFAPGHGFGPRSGHGIRSDIQPRNGQGLQSLVVPIRTAIDAIPAKLKMDGLGNKIDKNLDKLGHLQAQLHRAQQSGDDRRITRLQQKVDRQTQRVDATKQALTSTTVQTRDAARHAGITTTSAEQRGAAAIVKAIYAAVPNINLFVTASNVEAAMNVGGRAGPRNGSAKGGDTRQGGSGQRGR